MRILTFLMLAVVVGTGHAWAQDEEYQFGHITYNGTAANDGGTLTFYTNSKDAGQGTNPVAPNGTGPTDLTDIMVRNGEEWESVGTGFFIKATPAVGHRLPAPVADGTVSFIRAEVVTQAQQAPSRRAVPTLQVGQTLPVKFHGYYIGEYDNINPVTDYYGLYYVVMPADVNLSVSITATFPEVETMTVDYIDPTKTGDAQNCSVTAYVLDGTEERLGYGSYNNQTQKSWYVLPANATYNYTNGLELYGKVHLILADGATMTIGTDSKPVVGKAAIYVWGDLDIYGQSGQSGTLNATTSTSSSSNAIHLSGNLAISGGVINAKSDGYSGIYSEHFLTINGGTVTSTSTVDTGISAGSLMTINGGTVTGIGTKVGIHAGGDLVINGGQVTGTGDTRWGIYSFSGNIILGWTNPTDFIKASSYILDSYAQNSGKVVKTAEGKVLKYTDSNNNTVKLRATLTATEVEAIADKTLTPYGLGGYCGTTENDADGKNMTWEIPLVDHDNDDSTPMQLCTAITIEGEGSMADYSGATAAPWKTLTYNLILVDNETAYTTYASMLSNADKAMLAPNKITVTKNESGWGTYCFRYPVSYSLSDATAYMISGLNSNKTAVTLSDALDAVAPDTPLLLNYSGDDDGTLTAIPTMATTVSDDAIVSQNGTDVITYGNPLSIALNTDVCSGIINPEGYKSYVLSKGQFIRIDKNDGLAAHRCVLNVGGNTNSAPVLSISTEVTGVKEVKGVKKGSWYTIDGRKLNGKPTQKGIYVNGGRKVVVK